MAKKGVIYVRECLCLLTAFIIGVMLGEIDNAKIAGKVESAEIVNTELEKEEKPLKTGININNSFAQIETSSIHKIIEFPSIEIAGADGVADLINEQIYSEIIPDDFEQYHNGREDVRIGQARVVLLNMIIRIEERQKPDYLCQNDTFYKIILTIFEQRNW